jgi:hypothetical protein
MQVPMPGVPPLTMTDQLEATDGGTRVTTRIARPRTAKDRAALAAALPVLRDLFDAGRRALVPLIEADTAGRAEASAAVEPELPVSRARFAGPDRVLAR